MVKRNKFYESLTNKKILTKKVRGIDYYSIQIKNNHIEDDDNNDIDELEVGIDKTIISSVDVTVDVKGLLIEQIQAKQIIDDIAFEKENLEINKIIKEQEKYIKIVSFSDTHSNTDSDSDSDTDSDSDSDSELDFEINEIGTEDYNFLINF